MNETLDTGNIYILVSRQVLVKHGCPRQQQSEHLAKSVSPTVLPRPTQKACEKLLHDLTNFQVWLLYDHPNF